MGSRVLLPTMSAMWYHEVEVSATCAPAMREVTKMPSTPKGVKKFARLRVRRNGTGSGRSRAPVPSYCGAGG